MIILFVTASINWISPLILGSRNTNPATTDAIIKIIPVTNVKILMNPAGVGFVNLAQALSTSNALMRNAAPSMLIKTAKISAV
jgi:hypothetical protein